MLGCPEGGKPRGVGRIVLLQTKSGRSFGYGPPGGEPFDRNCPMAQVKAGRYMAGTVTEELAALRNPLLEPGTVTPEDCYDDACEQALEQRKRDTLRLEAASDDQQINPLPLALEDLKAQKEAVDAQIRQLLPYGRVPRQPSLRAGGARPRYRIQLLRGAHRLQRAGDPAGHRADRQGAEPAAPRQCQRRPVSATNGAVRGRRRVWGASETHHRVHPSLSAARQGSTLGLSSPAGVRATGTIRSGARPRPFACCPDGPPASPDGRPIAGQEPRGRPAPTFRAGGRRRPVPGAGVGQLGSCRPLCAGPAGGAPPPAGFGQLLGHLADAARHADAGLPARDRG
ncbi:hypothetical protein SHIRM173S_05369 [Streptomyces hirsutus]